MRRRELIVGTLSVVLWGLGSPSCSSGQELSRSLKQLTFDPAVDYYPTWSPDGRWIAFSSGRNGGQAIWKVPSDGGQPVAMTHGVDNHPSWSPEGSFVAYDARGSNVQVVSPAGGVPIRIGPAETTLPVHAYPSWSPDGSAVLLSGGETVYSVDLPSGSLTALFSKEGYSVRAFNHSSDGSRVVARIYPGEDVSDGDIWLIPLDGSEAEQLTDFPGRESTPRFSPDGTMIVFAWDQGDERSIQVIPSAGGAAVTLTTYQGLNGHPCWSPDGTKIAFTSDRGGNPDIWVMEIDLEALRNRLGIGQ